MNIRARDRQQGVALLIFVVIMMGIGGIVLIGFSQGVLEEVRHNKGEHNQRVLQEAKQALLQFAYNYPVTNQRGPGRLPCPDLDNDGIPETPFGCSSSVGRLPWKQPNLNLHDMLDADGERLWYAVSNNFSTQDASNLNSDTHGTITLVDQAMKLIYDGEDTAAKSGIAAVIIAPGAELPGQNRVADANDAANYLDSFGGYNNAVFNNGESDTSDDGFILGPVFDPVQNINAVNDRFILVTAAEVLEVAEKAVLQAYRNAIEDYQRKIWGGTLADYRYPWLDSYASSDGLGSYNGDVVTPATPDPKLGRVPSIFAGYFSGSVSESIRSEIALDFFYDGVGWDETTAVANIGFDAGGNLVTDSSHNSGMRTYYLWDGHADPSQEHGSSPHDGVWELCTGTAGTGAGGTTDPEDDCNRKTNGTFKTPADTDPDQSDVWLEVKVITLEFNPAGGNITFFDGDLRPGTIDYAAPTATGHARVRADFGNGSGYLAITNDIDRDFRAGFDIQETGPPFGAGDRVRVGIRFYPELPGWALDNGWHNMIQLAYSSALQPGGDGTCDAGVDDCLTLLNSTGVTNDKTALLILSGSEGDDDPVNSALIDEGGGPEYYFDDLADIFEGENSSPDLIFDKRPANSNDIILSLD